GKCVDAQVMPKNEGLAMMPGLLAGEPAGIRTQDTRIKSPVLYRLSYGLLTHVRVFRRRHKSTTVSRILSRMAIYLTRPQPDGPLRDCPYHNLGCSVA